LQQLRTFTPSNQYSHFRPELDYKQTQKNVQLLLDKRTFNTNYLYERRTEGEVSE
jgi:hypothetical protein